MSKTLIILNPAAKSERAGGLASKIEEMAASSAVIRCTTAAGEARSIAEWGVAEGFDQVVAAGGDGTINEVVNGIAHSNVALGILPVGSMNVFAAELGIPKSLKECWEIIRSGKTREVDLPDANGHAFVQLAGVGLDAQVVQETSWDFKRSFGPLSYLISATHIAARKPPKLGIEANGISREGSFVLVGNGRFYGGPFPIFTNAQVDDGLLDVLVFKNLGYLDIVRYVHAMIFGNHVNLPDVDYFRAETITVNSDEKVPVEVDGEVIGGVPVVFHCSSRRLRVLSPAA